MCRLLVSKMLAGSACAQAHYQCVLLAQRQGIRLLQRAPFPLKPTQAAAESAEYLPLLALVRCGEACLHVSAVVV